MITPSGTFGMLFGVGVPVSIKARSYWPAATAALVGTMLDFAYGYNFACAEMVDNYRRAAEVNCVRQSVSQSMETPLSCSRFC